MANHSMRQPVSALIAFVGADAAMICGMVVSVLGEALARRDTSVLELIPSVMFAGLVLGLIPLSLSAFAYLIARAAHRVTAVTAAVTGAVLGAPSGWLIGPPAMRAWSGSVVGVAAALVWWKLYTWASASERAT
jgi:hypothetical protein